MYNGKKEEKEKRQRQEHEKQVKAQRLFYYTGLLNRTWNERIDMYNKENTKRNKHHTKLSFPEHSKEKLYQLFQENDHESVVSSFMVYADEVLKGERDVRKIIPFFLSQNENDDFTVYYECLDKYNLDYSYEVKQ